MIYTFVMTVFIYPICAGWIWSDGWLQRLGFIDFAGSGAIHLLGGVCGLIGTIVVGPRLGYFSDKKEEAKKKIIS